MSVEQCDKFVRDDIAATVKLAKDAAQQWLGSGPSISASMSRDGSITPADLIGKLGETR
jgi:hypothetical protein